MPVIQWSTTCTCLMFSTCAARPQCFCYMGVVGPRQTNGINPDRAVLQTSIVLMRSGLLIQPSVLSRNSRKGSQQPRPCGVAMAWDLI